MFTPHTRRARGGVLPVYPHWRNWRARSGPGCVNAGNKAWGRKPSRQSVGIVYRVRESCGVMSNVYQEFCIALLSATYILRYHNGTVIAAFNPPMKFPYFPRNSGVVRLLWCVPSELLSI